MGVTERVGSYLEQVRRATGRYGFDDYLEDLQDAGVDTVSLDVEAVRSEYTGPYNTIHRPLQTVEFHAQAEAEGLAYGEGSGITYIVDRGTDHTIDGQEERPGESREAAETILDGWETELENEGFDVLRGCDQS